MRKDFYFKKKNAFAVPVSKHAYLLYLPTWKIKTVE
jgi:hypothetical protein